VLTTPISTDSEIGCGKLKCEVSGKPVLPRKLAHRDVEAAVDYYAREAGPDIALRFIEALQSAYRAIAGHPGLGRLATRRNLPFPDCGAEK
jgi:toxin ParE1/3/4